ncbi:MAG: hypothetical protein ATN31_00125 [Candidatus Epulonipiscioides saccharophilum]|nr:MAG: hypothetical protein ATN31_00125 [Epulopiscium sp. AS2M-Bin001]
MKKKFSNLIIGALLAQSLAYSSPIIAYDNFSAVNSFADSYDLFNMDLDNLSELTTNIEDFIPPEEREDEVPNVLEPVIEELPDRYTYHNSRFIMTMDDALGEWVTVSGVTGGKIKFDKLTGTVTSAEPTVTVANIPAQIEGVAVTTIGKQAFYQCASLTSVILPDSVTTLEDHAFRQCTNLVNMTLSENIISIGEAAFYNNPKMRNVIFGATLESIGNSAFANCDSFTSLDLPASLTYIDQAAFYHCGNITNVNFGQGADLILATSVFSTCIKLSSININSRVKSIDQGVFTNCLSLNSITFDEGIHNIGKAAFLGTPLTSVTLPRSLRTADWAFYGLKELTSVTLPDNITSISEHMFENCVALATIKLPDSITSLKEAAFEGCTILNSINIPAGVTELGASVFQDCKALTAITIPSGVTKIPDYAFSGCLALNKSPITDKITSIGSWAFYNCDKILDLTIPNSVKTIGSSTFRSMELITQMSLPDSVTSLGTYAFMDTQSLKTVRLSANIPTIAEGTFYRCYALEEISIPDSVTTIENEAFRDAIGLKTISISSKLRSTGEDIFSGCSSLGAILFSGSLNQWKNLEVKIPHSTMLVCSGKDDTVIETDWIEVPGIEGGRIKFNKDYGAIVDAEFTITSASIPTTIEGVEVEAILSDAFRGCSELTSVSMPDSLYYLGDNAFRECTFLKTVTLSPKTNHIGEWCFAYCDALDSISIPSAVKEIQTAAFYLCLGLKKVELTNGLTNIMSSAFQYCQNLESITLPDSLLTIGSSAFKGCAELTFLRFPDRLTEISYMAFENCTGLQSIAFQKLITTIDTNSFNNTPALETIHYAGIAEEWAKVNFKNAQFGSGVQMRYNSTQPDLVAPTSQWITVDGIEGGKIKFENQVGKGGVILDAESTITSANIPKQINGIDVKEIASYAFALCDQLTEVTIPATVEAVQNYVFKDCRSLETINIISEEGVNPALNQLNGKAALKGTSLIGHGAFLGCIYLKNVNIGESVLKIGNNVFEDCLSLEMLMLPQYITEIGENTFRNCSSLAKIEFGGTQALWNTFKAKAEEHTTVICDDTTPQTWTNVPEIVNGRVEFLAGMIKDAEETITVAKIPATINAVDVTTIGVAAFYNLKQLTEVVIPDSVTTIQDSAFLDCSELTTITIPNTITSAGNKIFNGCDKLVTIKFAGSRAEWNDTGIIAPQHTTVEYGVTESWITVDGIKGGKILFDFKTGEITDAEPTITSADIPVSIVDGIMLMDGFNTEKVPVTSIKAEAFADCSALIDVRLPIGLTNIGDNAFKNSSLETIIIPASVKTMATNIFAEVTTLNKIYYGDTKEKWDTFTINVLASTEIEYQNIGPIDPEVFIQVPGIEGGKIKFNPETGSITAAEESITIANIPAILNGIAVTTIDPKIFQRNINLIELTLPEGLTTIGAYAFEFCDALKTVTIPSSVSEIGTFAFARSRALTEIIILTTNATEVGISTFWNPYIDSTIHFAGTKDQWRAFDTGISIRTAMAFESTGQGLVDENWNKLRTVPGIENGTVKFDEETGTITAADSKISRANIPSTIDNIEVTAIGNSAFRWNANINQITLPDTVTSIGHQAFYDLSDRLTAFSIPEKVTFIGEQAFAFCDGISSITIPKSLLVLSPNIFNGCINLATIELNAPLASIGTGALVNTAITELILPFTVTHIVTSTVTEGALTFGEKLKKIYYGNTQAVWDSLNVNAPNVEILCENVGPLDSNRWIDAMGFIGGKIKFDPATGEILAVENTITDINIPKQINSITITGLNDNLLIDSPALSSVFIPKNMQIGSDALWSNSPSMRIMYEGSTAQWLALKVALPFINNIVTDVESPEDMTVDSTLSTQYDAMGGKVKFDKTNGTLLSVDPLLSQGEIPETIDGVTVKRIGPSAFRDNGSITEIVIPKTVTALSNKSFANMSALTSIIIPKLTEATAQIFDGSIALETLYYEGSESEWNAFGINTASSVNKIFNRYPLSANVWRDVPGIAGGKIKFDEATGTILESEAVNLDTPTKITQANIPVSINGVNVIKIGANAFANQSYLTDVRVPHGVTSIAENGFARSGLETIVLPGSLETVASNIFDNCVSLQKIYFALGEAEWTSLNIVKPTNAEVIYNSQGPIDPDAWIEVNGIIGGRIKINNEGVITEAEDSITLADIPQTVNGMRITDIDQNAFYQHPSLIELKVSSNIQIIQTSSFTGSNSLKKVTLGEGVKKIAVRAFSKCANLETVILPKSLVEIETAVFELTPKLNVIYFAGTQQEWDALDVDILPTVKVIVESTGPVDPNQWISVDGVVGGQLKFNEATGTITEIESTVTQAIIPETINGVNVLSIADNAFSGCSSLLEKVGLPNTILTLGTSMFENCIKLTEVVLPNALSSIGDKAFNGCGALETINLPSTLLSIGASAFNECNSLKAINLPSTLTSIGASAFKNCDSIESITIPAKVTAIAADIVASCDRLETIVLSENITSIASGVFTTLTRLDTIFFGSDKAAWTKLGANVPTNTLIIFKSVELDEDQKPEEEVPSPEDLIGPEAWITVSGIEGGRIQFNEQTGELLATDGLVSVANIPAEINGVAVTSIGSYAFYNCSGLTEISIPDSVSYIGDNAFVNCSSLASITIPSSVEYIGESAFHSCRKLANITLPDSLSNISYRMFYGCTNLSAISLPNVTSIEPYAFSQCLALESIDLPESLTSIGDFVFEGAQNLQTISLPSNVESIGNNAFVDCLNLSSITLNDNLSMIGESAFENCTALASIDLPANISNISDKAFLGCSSLSTVTLPDSMTSIANAVFAYCGSLAEINLPDTIISVGDNAFHNTAISTLNLAESLSYLGYDTFEGIASLNISFGGSQQQWDALDRVLPSGVTVTPAQ